MTESVSVRHRPDRPWAGVVAVVLASDAFLLTRRRHPPHQGAWGLPGGAIRTGETIFAAATRELREETGLTIMPARVLTAVDVIEGAAPDYHFMLAVVLARLPERIPPCAGDDAAAVRWVTLDELTRLPHVPGTAALVELAPALKEPS